MAIRSDAVSSCEQFKNKRGELKEHGDCNRYDSYGEPNVVLVGGRGVSTPDESDASCLATPIHDCIQHHIALFGNAAIAVATEERIGVWSQAARNELCFTLEDLMRVSNSEMRQWGCRH